MKTYYTSLKKFHTFKINVFAKKIIIVKTIKTLIKTWKKCNQENLPFLLLGKGSNVLFTKNYNGFVVVNRISGITIHEQKDYWLLHVKGGTKWNNLVKYTIQKKIYGLENLALIPGTVGAAPIQNIGAYGVEFKDVCQYVDVLYLNNSKIVRINSNNCLFGYRDSIFKKKHNPNSIILSVGIKLPKTWKPKISHLELQKLSFKNITSHQIFHYICKLRKKKLPNPKKIGNAGSFFKNPIIKKNKAHKIICEYKDLPFYPEPHGMIKLSAGWLIEKCKLKNFSVGNAKIYHKQALILINKNNLATSKNIIKLAKIIISKVKKKFDITLELEVQIIN
ncbi:UDP-N-acetylenolpyruvoylglucosamine reductase [Buchnera aphidicola str. Bp (Baizongia pistaciae)]|uniref:UDP-N-acetylenolpyruvoylglucosamine reductase n=1 Tax=Buchnera aphidicola subsp. Baizongia pistaciae (strain Bp) TaxID=224915 RepID=MURB_BUCBP|nr:UDP-N-acetylmuramate dehydrogenase [Buchnera aphidicola]P59450.1 RecName: Full=UDP-N-acetylenolpyruvoylglucosamine reductase; AltName: Full=UDP-N-acetylmuramate dehydrogenase [Buchnera aphidicola str. Bp (Baizongia pistaciae)]AAO26785.1 UDP-N-acetylenolpyruvoylglucosamine reductase [Buchnera aphidicola str. Bp (Baizongia pistaciae)]